VAGGDQVKGIVIMSFRKFVAAVAAAGLIGTSSLAAAANAAPATAEVLPANETIEGQQELYGASILLQLGIVIVAAALIYFAASQLGGGGDDDPASP
jgi:hypothetical protein